MFGKNNFVEKLAVLFQYKNVLFLPIKNEIMSNFSNKLVCFGMKYCKKISSRDLVLWRFAYHIHLSIDSFTINYVFYMYSFDKSDFVLLFM